MSDGCVGRVDELLGFVVLVLLAVVVPVIYLLTYLRIYCCEAHRPRRRSSGRSVVAHAFYVEIFENTIQVAVNNFA